MATLHFWFEFASTYSYPAAWRVEAEARARGVALRFEPFLLGPIFAAQGWKDSPFNLYPVKGRYMWRDLERLCAAQGLPFRRPSTFPRSGLLAARVACAAREEPWLPGFVRGVYRANFGDDREIAAPEVIGEILAAQGQRAETWLERANAPETKQALREQTERAVALGIFGAPSFTLGGELFWGNDRMAQALDAACAAQPRALGAARVRGLDHVYVSVSDFARSEAFYDRVMAALGFRKGDTRIAGEAHAHYFTPELQYTIRPARSAARHDPYAPGLHHVCFQVASPEVVDLLQARLREQGVPASEPRRYPEYHPDYYASFFEDPDGMQAELTVIVDPTLAGVHAPRPL